MDILDIFYNYIVKEASIGKVKCFYTYSILFQTNIEDNKNDNSKYLCPVLTIHDKNEFDKLLINYVDLCLDFYGTKSFNKNILNKDNYSVDRTSPEKFIMSLLWANATYDDFLNPEEYLRKRISFIKNSKEEYFYTEYSNMLDGNIMFHIEKDTISNETPYKIGISLIGKNGEEYFFPEIKYGIYNDTVYIYAIQSYADNDSSYSKKVNRILYKIGEGFDINKDNYELYGEGNLKDVTSSFVVAINIAINYFHKLGYRKIEVASILPVRWNSKNMVLERNIKQGKYSEEEGKNLEKKIEDIQKNLTEKFIRTFLRLEYHYEGINVVSIPFLIDSNLHIELDDELITNNTLLNETKNLINTKNNVKNL